MVKMDIIVSGQKNKFRKKIFDGMKWETFSDKMTSGISCATGGACMGACIGGFVGSIVGALVGVIIGFLV